MSKEDNSFGIASVILGILSIVFSITLLFGSLGGLVLGLVALVFALIQNKKSKNKWSKAGLWLSIIGIVISIVFVILFVQAIADLASQIQTLQTTQGIN